MADSLDRWTSGALFLDNYGGVTATARMSRGSAGEVTATFACNLPQGVFDAFYLRYDPSRGCVDAIAHLDMGEAFSLESSTRIPADLIDAFAEAADELDPDPVRLFYLMNRVEACLAVS